MNNKKRFARRCAIGLFCTLSLALIPEIATASMAVGWWSGDWDCNIDGRPARMQWDVVDDSQTRCEGGACSSTSGVRWVGRFSDNGSKWVPLRQPRSGNRGGLYFRHADGNQWYLAEPINNRTTGWTTWNGKRYALSCWR